ncbi:hypothetical protein MSUIS_01490 [Mycoplasma suis KI3806]|uniref:Uncharacterized protein n=1 Tax=Mycoplasma suis (strain KI_3806) TaxID=708248 RepID=F0V320_MYCS3|nr:hypothetical protein [Mycoplasma suis]CBZ40242.1 hypothetical protein MSUIS_01490 [Mycoplasma suis KI3806]
MGFLGATKIAFLAISIIGTTATGGIGLSYKLKQEMAKYARKKRSDDRKEKNLERQKIKAEREELDKKELSRKLVFKAEAIFKSSEVDKPYVCWEWSKNIHESHTVLDEQRCQEKVKEIWRDNSESQPERWFKSDWSSAIVFFEKYLSLPAYKQNLLKTQKEASWDSGGFLCNHKKDIEDDRIVTVNCNKIERNYLRRR